MKRTQAGNIDEYIAGFPKNIQHILEEIRATIRKAAPEAEEAIKYAIPTFVYKGNLVHFGAFNNHIGFYPAPTGIEEFEKELSAYQGANGTIRFPLDKPLPLALIRKIVKFRMKRNAQREKTKKI